jgi:hypothetical protein
MEPKLVSHRKKVTGVCAYCGKEFVGYTTKKTCSDTCRTSLWAKNNREVYNQRQNAKKKRQREERKLNNQNH